MGFLGVSQYGIYWGLPPMPVLWLHKITTAFARRWYTEQFATNLKSRMGPLLVLAERIAAERGAQT